MKKNFDFKGEWIEDVTLHNGKKVLPEVYFRDRYFDYLKKVSKQGPLPQNFNFIHFKDWNDGIRVSAPLDCNGHYIQIGDVLHNKARGFGYKVDMETYKRLGTHQHSHLEILPVVFEDYELSESKFSEKAWSLVAAIGEINAYLLTFDEAVAMIEPACVDDGFEPSELSIQYVGGAL